MIDHYSEAASAPQQSPTVGTYHCEGQETLRLAF